MIINLVFPLKNERTMSEVLSKLQNLGPTGLGTGESKEELIKMYKDIRREMKGTNRKLTGLTVVATATIGAALPFSAKTQQGLIKSGRLYHGWMQELDRRLNTFQAQTNNQ
jgi:hypothetical protein